MLCPHCKVRLSVADRQSIEIDYCSECRGVWLDRGELDKIIDRSHSAINVNQPAQNDYQSRDKSHDKDYRKHYKHKKPKSMLPELFDF